MNFNTVVSLLVVFIGIGLQFSSTKLFKNNVKNSEFADYFFSFATMLLSTTAFFIILKGNIGFNLTTLVYSAAVALFVLIYTVLGLKAVTIGRLSVFTMFIMLGGMILPFFYGIIFLGERITVSIIAGIILLLIALILPIFEKTEEQTKKPLIFYGICFLAFLCNGFVSIFLKMHQIQINVLDTIQFSFYQSVCGTVIIGVMLLFSLLKKQNNGENSISIRQCFGLKSMSIILFATIVSRIAGVINLDIAKTMDASVLFPLVTGGTILATALLGRIIFKEKLSKHITISLAINVAAIVIIMLNII